MDKRLKEKIEQSNNQIKSAKKYAQMYQKAFEAQANIEINRIKNETLQKKDDIQRDGNETMKKIEEISKLIEEDNIENLLNSDKIL